jgi:hypothetical protein
MDYHVVLCTPRNDTKLYLFPSLQTDEISMITQLFVIMEQSNHITNSLSYVIASDQRERGNP